MSNEVPVERDLSQVDRSWRTRMASVMRQFDQLTEEKLEVDEVPHQLYGLVKLNGSMRLTVAPSDPAGKAHHVELESVGVL